jgi:N,N'-diacetyllegionaminate synthase
MLKKLELTQAEFLELQDWCRELSIAFLSTAFDMESLDFLESLDPFCYKIPSGEITNYPYLRRMGQTGRPILLSTGMSQTEEIQEALEVLKENGAGDICLLHCTTEYPAPLEDVNLRAMQTLSDTFGLPVGYSDHTEGITVPVAAAAMGAVVLEKHFTLDRGMEGPDHKASLEPGELAQMVKAVRQVELALGRKEKCVTKREWENRKAARKSIVAARDIQKGTLFTEENLTAKRPGDGISPMKWREILGKTAPRDFKRDERIQL